MIRNYNGSFKFRIILHVFRKQKVIDSYKLFSALTRNIEDYTWYFDSVDWSGFSQKEKSRDETHLLRWVLTENTFTHKWPGRGDGVVSWSVVRRSVWWLILKDQHEVKQ